MQSFGLSGLSIYVPPYRVDLEQWCRWTGQPWPKIAAVVGHSFRMRGPWENVYTMAAGAVLRLIRAHRIDPSRVRFLALGTESSTDNSAGAVVVKGLVNQALDRLGLPRLNRACEVPEFKHACLGGVYGLKGAARFLAFEPEDSIAIVVSADVAEYARGSSGEPTQGAGAVAMLLDGEARLARLDLAGAGSASDYRVVDFRKPAARMLGQASRYNGQFKDFPVFNGKYSTTCYVDATLHAFADMLDRRGLEAASYLREVDWILMHRPYRRMPESGLAMCALMALARGDAGDRADLARLAADSGVDADALVEEFAVSPDLARLVAEERINDDVYPLATRTLGAFRSDPLFGQIVSGKLELGAGAMMDIGNLYTAALPAWMAAAFDDAGRRGIELAGREMLLLGYGSGDAAEAVPITVSAGWREAAALIDFPAALGDSVDLDADQYRQLHDVGEAPGLSAPERGFRLEGLGERAEGAFQDLGIEYYSYHG